LQRVCGKVRENLGRKIYLYLLWLATSARHEKAFLEGYGECAVRSVISSAVVKLTVRGDHGDVGANRLYSPNNDQQSLFCVTDKDCDTGILVGFAAPLLVIVDNNSSAPSYLSLSSLRRYFGCEILEFQAFFVRGRCNISFSALFFHFQPLFLYLLFIPRKDLSTGKIGQRFVKQVLKRALSVSLP
jgi:hypothetical protein